MTNVVKFPHSASRPFSKAPHLKRRTSGTGASACRVDSKAENLCRSGICQGQDIEQIFDDLEGSYRRAEKAVRKRMKRTLVEKT